MCNLLFQLCFVLCFASYLQSEDDNTINCYEVIQELIENGMTEEEAEEILKEFLEDVICN